MARTTRHEKRVTVRLAAPLLDELEVAAEEDARPTAAMIRKILLDWTARHMAERASQAA